MIKKKLSTFKSVSKLDVNEYLSVWKDIFKDEMCKISNKFYELALTDAINR